MLHLPTTASTYALNFALNYVQDRYATQSEEDYAEIVALCCIVKPLVTWHAERTATICRERCGGQGFLACNRFGEAIVGAHAGITAEGDNRVIQQKVSKELLDGMRSAKSAVAAHLAFRKLPGAMQRLLRRGQRLATSSSNPHAKTLELLAAREQWLKCELAGRLYESKKAGTPLFDAWMLQESDNVQALATAYGQRIVVEQFDLAIETAAKAPGALAWTNVALLRDMRQLYALNVVLEDAAFFLAHGFMSPGDVEGAQRHVRELCASLGAEALTLTAGFGIDDAAHHAPIAHDFVKYFDEFNFGETDNQAYREANVASARKGAK